MKFVSKPANNLGHWLSLILKEVSNRAMSVIFVLLIFILLWFVPQINDLILVLNQSCNHWITTPVFFTTLVVFAFFISALGDYFSPPGLRQTHNGIFPDYPTKRMYYFRVPKDVMEVFIDAKNSGVYAQNATLQESSGQYIRRVFPKLLGSLLILVATFAVNHTFTEVYGKSIAGGNTIFYVFLVVFLLLLHQNIALWITKQLAKFPKLITYGPIVLASICIVVIVILGFFNRGGTREDSVRLFYALLSLTMLFLILSLSYNRYVLWLKQKIGGRLIVLCIMFILLGYLALFFDPTLFEAYFTPISIIMICLIGIYTALNVVKIFGKLLDLQLLGITTLIAIALATYNAGKKDFDHYEASHTSEMKHRPSDRLSVKAYSEAWVADRLELIKQQKAGEKFPIILVSAEGGGSRAGLWSFLVQSYLFDHDPDYFEKYLFAMTGASGGGVGNNMFYVQANELLANPNAKPLKFDNWSPKYSCENDTLGFKYRASRIYNNDYLSSSVASLLGRDLLKSITNICIDYEDRGRILEQQWSSAFNEVFSRNDDPLNKAYLDMMPQKGVHDYIRPLLITNTTELKSGERMVISPVAIAEDKNNMAAFKDMLALYPDKDKMIRRSAAMSMNARFPYVSPAARITGLGQYGDAGYYNNIGGEVTVRLKNALVKALTLAIANDSTIADKFVIKHLVISNFEKHTALSYSSQLLAPLNLVASATFAHPKQNENSFSNLIDIESKRVKIPIEASTGISKWVRSFTSDTETDSIEPVIPLGRYMSRAAVRALEYRLEDKAVVDCLNEVLEKRNPNP
ncbi:hypothetical protein [Winogradskyella flava]|uniref:hypothetical protein n=1 Tax=Winogradskyella flava TaxID=1884876 RepID=UPI0024908A82|nr:hypothetical protein [Winogradskyella flava]